MWIIGLLNFYWQTVYLSLTSIWIHAPGGTTGGRSTLSKARKNKLVNLYVKFHLHMYVCTSYMLKKSMCDFQTPRKKDICFVIYAETCCCCCLTLTMCFCFFRFYFEFFFWAEHVFEIKILFRFSVNDLFGWYLNIFVQPNFL